MGRSDFRGELSITLVGTGTCVLRPERESTSILARSGDASLLIDLGPGVAHRLSRHMDPYSLNMAALTHLHVDHVSDLPALLFAMRNTPGVDRTSPLTIVGPVGLLKHRDLLKEMHGSSIEPFFNVYMAELDPVGGRMDGPGEMRLIWARARHGEREALSFRIEAGGRSVVITGDTEPCPELIALARDADLLIAECSATDDQQIPGHLSPSQIAEIANAASVRRIVLVHLYPHSEAADPLGALRKKSRAEAAIGTDSMNIEI